MEQLNKALAAASADLRNPLNDGTNAAFKGFRYATLGAVCNAVRPVLARHGLVAMQFVETPEPGRVTIRTRIAHASGEFVESSATWAAGQNIQHLGAAITYLRRYTLCSTLNIVGDDDDDAETIVAPTRKDR